jgi:drug/metabolite transporter (DMT)-like permease
MDPAVHDRPAPGWLVWTALGIVYVVWGSTYLAIAIVVDTMPPLFSGGVRFLVAGALVAGFLALRLGPGALRLSRAQVLGSSFVGLALLLGGNGLVMLGERDVPSGLAALIIAVVPLWIIVLRLLFREHVGRGTLVGVLVGFGGVGVLVVPRGLSDTTDLTGMAMLVVAGASWAVGSYYSKRLALPANPFVSAAAQMLAGGVGLVGAGLLAGELGLLHAGQPFATESVLALVYLVVFGSIVAFSAYTWLLQHAPVSKVATYAYVNPVVALALGVIVRDEVISLAIVLGGAMIVFAVGLVIRTESRPRLSVGALDAPPVPVALPANAEGAVAVDDASADADVPTRRTIGRSG